MAFEEVDGELVCPDDEAFTGDPVDIDIGEPVEFYTEDSPNDPCMVQLYLAAYEDTYFPP
eukprot:CAMPEP_0170540174 /NCGR_PEP_ID=MMETSP0211-20121228/217_1 /TAXON_ID=311385 /ORGANISM="Pseudokeronopsis sp., Strain OXSARD2" /LENGTH=59 /DNA_ID=CAMNT_0010842475 /DNA_START=373 /DNA_END=552 /DNA_ORIENTATION=-